MIRIVIAEDQQLLLGALGTLLSMEEDMEVVGQAKNGEEVLNLVEKWKPDVCIMDIEMPVKTGLDAAEVLRDDECKVIVLTTFARTGYFERARKANVSGYLLKDSPSEELANSIRAIMAGRKVYAPELIDMAYEEGNPLTEREEQVLKLIADGKTTKEIAGQLYLTNGTVRNYVSTIMDKLNVSNRIEAISKLKEKGWFK
ncbi:MULTISPECIES: response regulator transcription factor [Oceanobacillus]|uniref:Transcriptional regulatory protein DesR n=1 Tax=Oceanobacillus kimchii TaxID=746691 RepID=A0ABQ5TL26_9BACI|nr:MULTISPECIES: response regulator transcription factor [Oceanobacillus]MBT2600489.1 response regulator transcription factor [Oceanobacillus sp. ISL-74]MBT2650647.1 response regulator transcription factor [Oceanobacillus sp. ISL-73]MCT1578399.1 response regulator transcription factor [Oceanobacillus kimchii]MCT2134577.1 response regulator transcription factor [Oceanobacillus kimchii]OEH54810.1 two-component system response regulator [Oceanobacillus sp. E9]